jgi:hypothetical protein
MMRFSGSLFTIGSRACAAAARVVPGVVRRAGEAVIAYASPRWPVASGRSRGLLSATLDDRAPLRPRSILRGRAPYTLFIRSEGVRPWDAYVLAPLQLQLRALPRALGEAITEELRHGR